MKLEVTDTLEGQMRLWWVKACHWEGIAPQSKFVVFSPENPHQAGYDKAAAALQESLNPKTEVKKYDCWTSDTCYVCSGGTGIPRYHASSLGYRPTSPCDTLVTVIEAPNRVQALKKYKREA